MKRLLMLCALPAVLFVSPVVITCDRNPTDPENRLKNPPVISDRTPDTSISVNDTVRLRIYASDPNGNVVAYYWKSALLQRTECTTDSVLSAFYTSAGDDTVKIWVRDDEGVGSDTAEMHLSIHEWPPYFTSVPNDTVIRQGDTLLICVEAADTNGDGSGMRYAWSINPALFSDTTDSGIFRMVRQETGACTLLVKAIDAQGQESAVDTVRVYVCSGNARLAGLDIYGNTAGALPYSPELDGDTVMYRCTTGHGDDTLRFAPRAVDAKASIRVNGESLANDTMSGGIALGPGPDTVEIEVVSECLADTMVYRCIVYRPLSPNAKLSGLTLSAGTLVPPFASDTLEYVDTIDHALDSVTVIPVAEEPSAVVTVNGDTVAAGSGGSFDNLQVGPNTITVRVIAPDGTTERTYTVTIYRKPDENTELSLLEVSAGTLTPSFSPGGFEYRDTVADTVDSISVKVRAANGACKLYLNGTELQPDVMSANVHLPVAELCTLIVRSTLPDGTNEKTYRVVAFRMASAESKLARLSSDPADSIELQPAFEDTVYSYYDSVPYERAAVTVIAEPKHPRATVIVNGDTVDDQFAVGPVSLSTGDNQITVKVHAEDGITASTYTLLIYRAYSDDPILSGLSVSPGTLAPAFRDSAYLYTIEFAYGTSSFTVTPIARNAAATITVSAPSLVETTVLSGNASPPIALTAGQWDTVIIVVTAEDGVTQKTYRIAVTVQSAPPSGCLAEDDQLRYDVGGYRHLLYRGFVRDDPGRSNAYCQ